MKKKYKGFPNRNAKKPRTKFPEDKRPHITGAYIPEIPTTQQIKLRKNKIWCNFYLKAPNASWLDWAKSDINAIIDMWATICWGINSKTHRAMTNQLGLFQALWNKQDGKCAVSGVKLLGGPGHGRRSIGIDLIRKKAGVNKGNVRLVAGPLALTRWVDSNMQTVTIQCPNPDDYKGYDITFAIAKHLHWTLKKSSVYRRLPVLITFPNAEATRRFTSQNKVKTATALAEFYWFSLFPGEPDLSKGETGWEFTDRSIGTIDSNYNNTKHPFLKVYMGSDTLLIEKFYPPHRNRYTQYQTPDNKIMRISLADPTVDFLDEILSGGEKSMIESMQYFYGTSYGVHH